MRDLRDRKVDVCVLTGQPNYPGGTTFEGYSSWRCSLETIFKCKVYRVPIVTRGKSRLRLFLNYLSFVVSASLIGFYLIRKEKLDVVFVPAPSPILQAIPAIFLGKFRKIKTVVWVQDLWPESLYHHGFSEKGVFSPLICWLCSWIYSNATVVLVPSPAFKPIVLKYAPSATIVYHPNSVGDLFSSDDDGKRSTLIEAAACNFPIVFAGNIGESQNLEVVLLAAGKLRDEHGIHFFLVGDGRNKLRLQALAIELSLNNVTFLPQVEEEQIPAILRSARALLVTLRDEEAFEATIPNKLQAYMAIGRPIITSMPGIGAEIVKKAGAGFAAKPNNPEDLANKILLVKNMSENEVAILAKKARLYFEKNFDRYKLTSKLIEVLDK